MPVNLTDDIVAHKTPCNSGLNSITEDNVDSSRSLGSPISLLTERSNDTGILFDFNPLEKRLPSFYTQQVRDLSENLGERFDILSEKINTLSEKLDEKIFFSDNLMQKDKAFLELQLNNLEIKNKNLRSKNKRLVFLNFFLIVVSVIIPFICSFFLCWFFWRKRNMDDSAQNSSS